MQLELHNMPTGAQNELKSQLKLLEGIDRLQCYFYKWQPDVYGACEL